MDVKHNSLALAFCLAGGLIVVLLGAYVYYQVQQSQRQAAENLLPTIPEPTNPAGGRRSARPDAPLAPAVFSDADQEQLDRYRALIDRKNELLQQKDKLLTQQQEQHKSLQDDYDALSQELTRLLTSESNASDAADDAPPADDSADPAAELNKLRDALAQAKAAEETLVRQLEDLRTELGETEVEITAMQIAAEQNLGAVIDDGRMVRAAASEALVASGQAAVPTLIMMLDDRQPTIRAWAASVLGDMGPTASTAIGALVVATADPDDGVREAAARALRMIRD